MVGGRDRASASYAQPTVSKHLECCARPVSWNPRWTHRRRLPLKPEHFGKWMPGWLRSVGSGPLTSMRSNHSTAWVVIKQHQRKRKLRRRRRGPTANVTKEKEMKIKMTSVFVDDQNKASVLYGGTGLCQEDRFQSGPISLLTVLARGAGRH